MDTPENRLQTETHRQFVEGSVALVVKDGALWTPRECFRMDYPASIAHGARLLSNGAALPETLTIGLLYDIAGATLPFAVEPGEPGDPDAAKAAFFRSVKEGVFAALGSLDAYRALKPEEKEALWDFRAKGRPAPLTPSLSEQPALRRDQGRPRRGGGQVLCRGLVPPDRAGRRARHDR